MTYRVTVERIAPGGRIEDTQVRTIGEEPGAKVALLQYVAEKLAARADQTTQESLLEVALLNLRASPQDTATMARPRE